MSARPGRPPRGFTLIEVLVALAIMATLAAMAWRGVDSIERTRSVTQARMEQTLRINAVLGQFEQDLQALQETPAVPGLAFDGGTLRLTRRAETGMQVVAWSLRPNPDGTNSWLRWASPTVRTASELQETWLRTQQFQGNEAGQLRTLPGIVQWQVFCYRGNALGNCQSTGDLAVRRPVPPAAAESAPPPAQGQGQGQGQTQVREVLSSGVRLVLQFAGPDVSGTLSREIVIAP